MLTSELTIVERRAEDKADRQIDDVACRKSRIPPHRFPPRGCIQPPNRAGRNLITTTPRLTGCGARPAHGGDELAGSALHVPCNLVMLASASSRGARLVKNLRIRLNDRAGSAPQATTAAA